MQGFSLLYPVTWMSYANMIMPDHMLLISSKLLTIIYLFLPLLCFESEAVFAVNIFHKNKCLVMKSTLKTVLSSISAFLNSVVYIHFKVPQTAV